MSSAVSAVSWVAWNREHVIKETVDNVKYMEFNNRQPGTDTTHRVNWKGIQILHAAAQVAKYTAVDNFIVPWVFYWCFSVPRVALEVSCRGQLRLL